MSISYNFKTQVKEYMDKIRPDKEIEGQSDYLELYYDWWKGYDPNFHSYIIKTLLKHQKMTKKSLKMVKTIGEDHADLIFNERTKVALDNENQTKAMTDLITTKGMFTKINKAVELGYALSMAAVVMSVKGIPTNEKSGRMISKDGNIKFDVIDARHIVPITVEDGEITEACFISRNTNYYNFVFHLLNEKDNYEIHSVKYTFVKRTGSLIMKPNQIIEPFQTNSPHKWFMIVSPPIANNIDPDSNLPVPIWANCLDVIKCLDNKYNAYNEEFVLGRKRLFVNSKIATRVPVIVDGKLTYQTEQVFDPNDTAINILPDEDTKGDGSANFNKIQETGKEFREQALRDAINQELNILSQKLHFGNNYYNIGGGSTRPLQTATAVNAMSMSVIRTVRNYQTDLEPKMRDFFKAIIETATNFTPDNLGDINVNDIKIIYEDSIFEDKDAIQERDRKDVAAGLMSPEEYRSKHMSENKETAALTMQKYGLKVNQFLPALSAGAMSPQKFIAVVYGEDYANTEEGQAEVEYVRNAIENMNMGYELYNSQADLIKEQNPELPQDTETTHPNEPIKTKVETKEV